MDLAANEKAVHADFFNGKERPAPGLPQHTSPGFSALALLPVLAKAVPDRISGCGVFLSGEFSVLLSTRKNTLVRSYNK